jgi:5-methylthioadenosine/S-adenosylhomocysteine deaminase
MSENLADIQVINAMVLTMNSEEQKFNPGFVSIKDDLIIDVGPMESLSSPDIPPKKIIDARGGIVMPGLINAHTHAAMTCFRGMADDLPLMTWLNNHIFPAEAKLDQDKVFCGALLACAEMILSGTTCFSDMYLFEDAVAMAAKNSGIRAVVGEVLYDFPSPNYGPIEKGFEYTEMLIEKWKDDPLVTIAVEPHSPYLCSPELLIKASGLALDNHIPLIIHLSETKSEVKQIQKHYGKTPVSHMADLGVLTPNLLACHCVVLTDEDMDLLRQFDVKVAHNPESNMKLASGIAPIPKLLEKGVCVSIGTDGCASNNNLDMFLEMDTAAKLHKVNTGDPTVMDAKTVLKMCTIDSARALGLSDSIGSLEPGKKADLIVMDTKKPHLTPMYHPESHLVYAARGSDVDSVIINGKIVLENGKMAFMDIEQVMENVRNIAHEIRTKIY